MSRIPYKNITGAFHMNKYFSMELPARKSLTVEFPTSPNPTGFPGEEKLHPSHSQHPLVEVTVSDLFTCNGCKEIGSGRRFSCQQCDFQLHDFCALAPPALKSHPLHAQHQLVFYSKPKPGGIYGQGVTSVKSPPRASHSGVAPAISSYTLVAPCFPMK